MVRKFKSWTGKKIPRYENMKCHTEIKCPHYKGDGYGYKFDSIEFNFCELCNNKLLNQMIDQKKLEEKTEPNKARKR